MALREHLAELRRRFVISAIAILLGAAVGWYLYTPVIEHLKEPLDRIAAEHHRTATLNYGEIMGAFNIKIKLSIYLGIVVASPVWLYQVWAFIMPGLTRKERGYGLGFVAAAVPLFGGGVALAWFWLPRAVEVLTHFAPEGTSNIIDAEAYISFATRLMLAFGIAFVIPLLLVMLNFIGVLSGARMGRAWRIAVFAIFLFAAVVSPSPEPGGMVAMAIPMVLLYVIAVGVSLLNDRRRRRNRESDEIFGLADDESSPLTRADPVVDGAEPLDVPGDRFDAT